MNETGRRILILVPHPDDEIVGFCAALGRAQQKGASIFALYLTHGCIAKESRWPWDRRHHDKKISLRKKEALAVADLLNITPIDFMDRPARYLWQDLENVYQEVSLAIQSYAISEIWLPAYEGGNADHDALNALGQVLKNKIPVFEFSEYHFAGGKAQSQTFIEENGDEVVLHLTAYEEILKRKALDLYASEKMNLGYVHTEHEVFRPLASYDYSQPPHQGTLWYARFQWVPFRHPRVDFSCPEEVSLALTSFLEAACIINQRPS